METKIVNIDKENPDKEKILEAALLLKEGKLVVFPTETVYGIAVKADNPEAIKRLFIAKKRPLDKPITVLISDKKQVYELAREVPETAKKLMDKFWPGPLTIVLRKKDSVNDVLTAGSNTIGIRMPDHKVALLLIKEAGIIAAPSANISGNNPAVSAEEALKELDGLVDMIIDSGKTDIGVSSTVVDLTKEKLVILREGSIGRTTLLNIP
ncbi:MAG: L-threonylcarbamoyladenylate synthase [Candidatus Woesearchaeota archaeon]